MYRPICVRCGRGMLMFEVGVWALETTEKGEPYNVYSVDIWKCPECDYKVISGTGNPIHRTDERFDELVKEAKISWR